LNLTSSRFLLHRDLLNLFNTVKVNTRLAKLDAGEYDCIILAVAGLVRLGPQFAARIEQYLEPPQFMYGVSQGALGLQCRADDAKTIAILRAAAEHPDSSARCRAERALLRTLEGGCQVPLGVSTEVDGSRLTLSCTLLAEDGSDSIVKSVVGMKECPEEVGMQLANEIINGPGKGAQLLARFRQEGGTEQRPLTYGSAEKPNTVARPPTSTSSVGSSTK